MSDPPFRPDDQGSTVYDEVRRLIASYGFESVSRAVKEQNTSKLGRPRIDDWLEIMPIIRSDAHRWLAGRDPFSERSNYAIAKSFVERGKTLPDDPVFRRLMRKLGNLRCFYTLLAAERLSFAEYPYPANLRAIAELTKLNRLRARWDRLEKSREASIADYETKFGPAPPDTTMQRIIAAVSEPATDRGSQAMENFLQALGPLTHKS